MSEEKIKTLIKESVKEVLEDEIINLRTFIIPEVSDDEQKEIEEEHGSPRKKRSYKSYSL
ncbi:MAG: hypothetical protein K9M12_02050 [Candidatus Pacebacteria bacterium]|nr:hypothetical protein [Candidatus Paceibacterota bacterium]